MGEPSVAEGLMHALFNFAVAKGADARALARDSGYKPSGAPDNRLPYERYVLLTRTAKDLTADDALALRFGEEVEMSQFSVVGLLGPPPGSIKDVVDYFNRYTRLLIDVPGQPSDRLQLARKGPASWVVDVRPQANCFPELTESTFARMVSTARRMGVQKPIAQLHVTHSKPAHDAEYDRIFRVPVRFGADWNAAELGEELLKLLPEGVQPTYAQRLAVGHAEALLNRLDAETTVKGRVAASVAASLENGGTTVEAVAKGLGVSRQTLYRRLKREGVTFERLSVEVRRKLAQTHLRSGKSVADVAHRLGFSDRAAFSKAFKRWTGTTPAASRSR